MDETIYDLKLKRDKILAIKESVDKCVMLCTEYIRAEHDFYVPTNLLADIALDNSLKRINSQYWNRFILTGRLAYLLLEIDIRRDNLSSIEDKIIYEELLIVKQIVFEYAVGFLLQFTKDGMAGKRVKLGFEEFTVPTIPGLSTEVERAERLCCEEIDILSKWPISNISYCDYSKILATIINDYDTKIADMTSEIRKRLLESKRYR